MKTFKSFLSMAVLAAGAVVGTHIANESIELVKDESKRAEVKRKFKSIKDTILKKEEES